MSTSVTVFNFALFALLGILFYLNSVHLVVGQNTNISMPSNIKNISDGNRTVTDLVQDPLFKLVGNYTNSFSYWNDPHNKCSGLYSCNMNLTDGGSDNQSFQLSTTNGTVNNWSWIKANETEVKPNQQYEFLTHMKLNEWATQSHIPLEGFNESSQKWYQIWQCPPGTNGPLEWKQFYCKITIPNNITKIHPTLNAGWSSQQGVNATTSFDEIHLFRIN